MKLNLEFQTKQAETKAEEGKPWENWELSGALSNQLMIDDSIPGRGKQLLWFAYSLSVYIYIRRAWGLLYVLLTVLNILKPSPDRRHGFGNWFSSGDDDVVYCCWFPQGAPSGLEWFDSSFYQSTYREGSLT